MLAGAVHDTTSCPPAPVAVTALGAPGAVAVAAGSADTTADGLPVPAELVAFTRTSWSVALVSPAMVWERSAAALETWVQLLAVASLCSTV